MTRDVKIKSTGTALTITENAKISESSLKMTEYLSELNSGGDSKKNRNHPVDTTLTNYSKSEAVE